MTDLVLSAARLALARIAAGDDRTRVLVMLREPSDELVTQLNKLRTSSNADWNSCQQLLTIADAIEQAWPIDPARLAKVALEDMPAAAVEDDGWHEITSDPPPEDTDVLIGRQDETGVYMSNDIWSSTAQNWINWYVEMHSKPPTHWRHIKPPPKKQSKLPPMADEPAHDVTPLAEVEDGDTSWRRLHGWLGQKGQP